MRPPARGSRPAYGGELNPEGFDPLIVEKGGEEHAGIGTDFDGIPDTIEGFEDPARYPALTSALLERGLDKAGVRLILGENFLRVLRRAEG